MTKLHEEFLRGRLSEVIETLSGRPAVKGECTLLVKGCEENLNISQDIVRAELIELLDKKEKKLSQVSKILAQKYGLSKNKVYEEALKLNAERSKEKE
jgi:16S rRNA (cytidine1402-2'-O)-methyltransferase